MIDITHSIEPQNVRHGALVLADVVCQFPPGSIHIGVVDPGVGTTAKLCTRRSETSGSWHPTTGY